jgi:hypothetical protein
MPDWNTLDLRPDRDAHPPDEPTSAPDGGAGGWEAFDDPDAPELRPAATPDRPEPPAATVTPAPDGGAGGWEAFDDPDAPAHRSPADWQDDPDQLAGKTRAELQELLQDWEQRPTTAEGGVRWFRPESKGADSVRWMPGNPDDPNPVKQAPYIRASLRGERYGPYPAGERRNGHATR